MEKRLTRLSGKSYNPQTQVSRKFVDLTPEEKQSVAEKQASQQRNP